MIDKETQVTVTVAAYKPSLEEAVTALRVIKWAEEALVNPDWTMGGDPASTSAIKDAINFIHPNAEMEIEERESVRHASAVREALQQVKA